MWKSFLWFFRPLAECAWEKSTYTRESEMVECAKRDTHLNRTWFNISFSHFYLFTFQWYFFYFFILFCIESKTENGKHKAVLKVIKRKRLMMITVVKGVRNEKWNKKMLNIEWKTCRLMQSFEWIYEITVSEWFWNWMFDWMIWLV